MQDDLTAAQRALGEFERAVRALRLHFGPDHDMRRLEDDVARMHSDLNLLADHAPKESSSLRAELQPIPDREYDPSLFLDAEDEGLGHH